MEKTRTHGIPMQTLPRRYVAKKRFKTEECAPRHRLTQHNNQRNITYLMLRAT